MIRAPSQPLTSQIRTDGATGLVARGRLTDRLCSAPQGATVMITAPAGYGKTTLLAEWAAADRRPFAWVSLRPEHDDAALLSAVVAEALDAVAAKRDPLVLVLDDLHALGSASALAVVEAIGDSLPEGSHLALAARAEPGLPLGRMRAQRRLVEIGRRDLAMTHAESRELLGAIGVPLDEPQLHSLLERTEGWPAALYLAGLALSEGEGIDGAFARFAGDDRFLADYLRDEFLAAISAADLRFLTRTSILDRMSGEICDAVLGGAGSGGTLRRLSRSNLLLMPLDRRDEWFRCHVLLREILLSELRRGEGGAEPGLHLRASAWYAERGEVDQAIDHAIAAGEPGRAGDLIWASFPEYASRGRIATIDRWLERFTDEAMACHPPLALSATMSAVTRGNGESAHRWVAVAARAIEGLGEEADPKSVAGRRLAEATISRAGLGQMRAEAAEAHGLFGRDSAWQSLSRFLEGTAVYLSGGPEEEARDLLEDSVRRAAMVPNVRSLGQAQLALLTRNDDPQGAAELASQAGVGMDRHGLRDSPTSALVLAVVSLFHARAGRVEPAAAEAGATARLLRKLRDYTSWYEAEARIVLAETHRRLDDVPRARELLGEARRQLGHVEDAAVLRAWSDETTAALDACAAAAGLTPAELRVLQFMPTHHSFREIAERLYVSPNTVKTQAQAIYRKLGVSGRAEAVERARESGLLGD